MSLAKGYAVPHPPDFTVCKNTKFALCNASTCVDTGTTITGNDGQTYEAASCVCPVLTGDSIADVNLGNMQGKCEADDPKTKVFSTYQFTRNVPQKEGFLWLPGVEAVTQVCPAENEFAECWNWECTIIPPEEAMRMGAFGIQLARCTCPIRKPIFDFLTQAGKGDPAACQQLPVLAPLIFDPCELGPKNCSPPQ
jgi:hypothetical protein